MTGNRDATRAGVGRRVLTRRVPTAPPRGSAGGWRAIALVVLGLTALVYGPRLLTSGLMPRFDALRAATPWLTFARDELLAGRLPAWDPTRLAGTPHLANIQAGTFYPATLLSLPFPPGAAVVVQQVAHVALGGLLMAALARGLGLGVAPAALAGGAYVAGAFTTARVFAGHTEILRTVAWAPLMLLAARRLALGGNPGWAAALGGSAALALLGGYPAFALYALGAAGVVFLGSLPEGTRRPRAALLAGGALGLAGLATAPALWPTLALSAQTMRANGLALDQALHMPLEIWDLPGLIWPYFYGSGPLGTYWPRPVWFWHETASIGGTTLAVLAARGAWRYRRERPVALLVLVGVGALLLALATTLPLYAWLIRLVPALSAFRYPLRLALIWALTVPVLAGYGLRALLERPRVEARALLRLGLGLGALGGLALCAVWLGWAPNAFPTPEELAPLEIRRSASLAAGATLALGALTLLALDRSATPRSRGGLPRRGLAAAAAGLALAELVAIGLPAMHTTTDTLPGLEQALGPEALAAMRQTEGRVGLGGYMRSYANTGRMLGFDSVTSYDPLLLARTTRLLLSSQTIDGGIASGSDPRNDIPLMWDGRAAFDVLGVSLLVVPYSDGEIVEMRVMERVTMLPRLSLVARARRVRSSERSLREVLVPGFDPHREVILERPAPVLRAIRPSRGVERVRVLSSRPGLVRVRVDAPRGGRLVFSESYYPDWVAEEGGQRVPLVPANHAIMAVYLAPGAHDLTLRFTTPWLGPALALGALGVLGLAGLALWGRRERRGVAVSR